MINNSFKYLVIQEYDKQNYKELFKNVFFRKNIN
jgi:hypothetical protein